MGCMSGCVGRWLGGLGWRLDEGSGAVGAASPAVTEREKVV